MPNAEPLLYIGLMSGTSLDGIDAALIALPTHAAEPQLELLGFATLPMPEKLAWELNQLNQSHQISLTQLCTLNHQISQQFIQATQQLLEQNALQPQQIRALGSHGQTIFHAPHIPMSLQIGHPAFIAKQTGITTVADFRIDDMANGGQGAPLAPAFHQYLFQAHSPIALINIGGIANISFIDNQQVMGFDTGPGNGLMDEVCQKYLNCAYDHNGQIAAAHPINIDLLNALMAHPYFNQPAPKSTGRETFNFAWLSNSVQTLCPNIPAEQLVSTLNQFTVNTLALALKQLPKTPDSLLICGGGAFNPTLMKRLAQQTGCEVHTTDYHHINPHAMEAMMCAWLAHQRLNHTPIALSSVTGATKPSVLGGIWHP